jgi:hypothetical protein
MRLRLLIDRVTGTLLALTLFSSVPAWAQGGLSGLGNGFSNSFGLPDFTKGIPGDMPVTDRMPPSVRVKPPNAEPQLDDLIQHVELPVVPVQPYSLEGTRIPGLTEKSVRQLGLNQFIVVANSPFVSMTDLYRDNRLRGKPNFVTADSIVHPYFAFTDGVKAVVLKQRVAGDLEALLEAMHAGAVAQYAQAQDAALRDDVEKNCAYLLVGLRLIHPEVVPKSAGQANILADKELKNIAGGTTARSEIFSRNEDYSYYQAPGWYASDAQLSNIYRCHQWLARMSFKLSDPDPEAAATSSNEFRRSVLLFQTLQLASVKGEHGVSTWKRLAAIFDTLGTRGQRDHLLLPYEYDSVFRQGEAINLNSLSEPFYRTRLLLAVRRQKPPEVGSASIFNTSEQRASADATASFRLFPLQEDPELPFLKTQAHQYTAEGADGPDSPLALLDLLAHGAPQASNVLSDCLWHLDPALAKPLAVLIKTVKQPAQSQGYALDAARWQILAQYYKPEGEHAQPALRSSTWLSRRLESAFAAWLDGHVSAAPLQGGVTAAQRQAQPNETATRTATIITPDWIIKAKPGNVQGAITPAQPSPAADTAGGAPHAPASFHYLEPCGDLYRAIASDCDALGQGLDSLNCLTDEVRSRFADFSRLSLRLAGIADRELSYQPVSTQDMGLLADMDRVLAKVDLPLAGTLYLNNGDGAKGGCTLALGHAGYLHVLCQTNHGMMMCRGPVYAYYELPGPPVTASHWERRLQFSMARPPEWTADFDFVQDNAVQAGR